LIENCDEKIIKFLIEEKALVKILDTIETEEDLSTSTNLPKKRSVKITNHADIWIN
jgi:hypothetical protein